MDDDIYKSTSKIEINFPKTYEEATKPRMMNPDFLIITMIINTLMFILTYIVILMAFDHHKK